jgi:hypothetical protein
VVVVTDRLRGCTKDDDKCIRFADGNKLGDDIRDSFRFPLSMDTGEDDSFRIDDDECSVILKFDTEDDCFGRILR